VEHCVFVHTNHKQWVGALVSEYAFKRNSPNADKFDVKIVKIGDYPFYAAHQGQTYVRRGLRREWDNEDLQSFTTLRFKPPEEMGYQGRAVVVDPDVFAVGDVWELLSRDMQGKAVMCRSRSGKKRLEGCLATSVMLLDCAKLRHWQVEKQFQQMFDGERDYMDWICLKLEDRDTVGLFENEWNDLDRLTERTKMLHTTKRRTQPWKTGLPVDFRPAERFGWFPPRGWLNRARRELLGEYALLGKYKRHPDPRQERFFFGLLKECVEKGIVSEDLLRQEMRSNHVRHDAFEVLDRTEPLPPGPGLPASWFKP
jgi:hypothetical protein